MKETFDIYSFINSPDVAKHCRKINHQFSTAEKAKLIYISLKSEAEKMQGYRWLIENAPDEKVPDKVCHILCVVMEAAIKMPDTIARKRENQSIRHIGHHSVIQYLKEATSSGKFVLPQSEFLGLKDVDVHLPHPFKKGDLVENIITGKMYVIEDIDGYFPGKRSEYMLSLWHIQEKKLKYESTMELGNLQRLHREKNTVFPDDLVLYCLGKYFKGKKALWDLLDCYADEVVKGNIKTWRTNK